MKIGVIQICSSLCPEENIKKIRGFLDMAADIGVTAVFLPECFYSMSDGLTASSHLVSYDNHHYKAILKLAKDYGIYILGGSAATLTDQGIVNRCYNFDTHGKDLGFYDKIHLFSCDIEGKNGERKIINEGDIYLPGQESKVINAGELKIGLSICFDVRYPKMYQEYKDQGVNLITISAAFTRPTGQAHWHTLIRARAIENQCFVVAPAQWGKHNERIETFGHSLVVDPWGEVLADAGEGEKLIVAEIDLLLVKKVRERVKL